MTNEPADQLREKDRAVITCIQDGHTDTRQIRKVTTLPNRDVNYSLDKLEDLGLVVTETPDGRVTRVVDGQKRNFKAPRKAELTETGLKTLQGMDVVRTKYRDLSHRELVERVQELEREIDDMKDSMEAFRRQVQNRLK